MFKVAWVRALGAIRKIPWRAVVVELVDAALEARRRKRADKAAPKAEEPPAPPPA